MKKQVFEQARSHIVEASQALRPKRVDDLRSLTTKQERETLKFGGKDFEVCAWARDHGSDKIAVVVEARTKTFLGWKVTAEGFYKDTEGVISDFAEKDYWEHDY